MTLRVLIADDQSLIRSGFSRIPVVGESTDDIIGLLYLKDSAARVSASSPLISM